MTDLQLAILLDSYAARLRDAVTAAEKGLPEAAFVERGEIQQWALGGLRTVHLPRECPALEPIVACANDLEAAAQELRASTAGGQVSVG